jgi:hypothetical protein
MDRRHHVKADLLRENAASRQGGVEVKAGK